MLGYLGGNLAMKALSFRWSMPVAFAQTRVGSVMPRLKPSSRGVLLLYRQDRE